MPALLLAGGGSGGHLSPGLAIAERLAERTGDAYDAVFVCSSRAIDRHMLGAGRVPFVETPARPPSAHPLRAIRFVRDFRRSRAICLDVIERRDVQRVVALGGFVAAPAVVAARRAGVDVTLLNLDRPPGKANRWMARRASRVWTAIDLPDMPRFAERVVGVPIRRQALAPADADRGQCRERLGLDPSRPTLLVTGASQGASSINELLVALARNDPGLFGAWQILHLAGHGSADAVRTAYAESGVTAGVLPFLDAMGLAWGAADLAVSRAGANSVAEVEANAVPTLFLPYPYHRDDHQRHNAERLVGAGGAVIATDAVHVHANVARIGPILRDLLANESRRRAIRETLHARPRHDAAATVVDLLLGAV